MTDNILQKFNNVYIYYNKVNKLLLANKQLEFKIKDYSDKHLNYTILTSKETAYFHPIAKIRINFNNILEEKTQNKETCFFIYQPLNEDVYVEKNDIIKFLKAKSVKIYFIYF